MRVKLGKRILLRRRRSKRDYFTTPEEVTEGALQIWRNLPEQIRQDPSLASFRIEHERLHGAFQPPEANPLNNEDVVNESDGKTKHVNISFPQIAINVTNSTGGEEREKDDLDPEDDREPVEEIPDAPPNKLGVALKWLKIIVLVLVWCVFTVFLMLAHEHIEKPRLLTVPAQTGRDYPIIDQPKEGRLGISLSGAFVLHEAVSDAPPGQQTPLLWIQVQRLFYDANGNLTVKQNLTDIWQLDVSSDIDTARELTSSKTFELNYTTTNNRTKVAHSEMLVLHLLTNIDKDLPLQVTLNESPIEKREGVIYAAIVLCGLYVMIIWDIVHRTFAAIIASSLAIGILAALNARPSMETIMSWIDVETLLLLFGMMILVAILSETGVFDYLAVYAYKITNGHIWPLINCLCVFTAILSSFLDNVTTVLLMTPVTIRLCEVMTMNPVPILMCMIIYSNIGGALTPVGDPPNVIIASNSYISSNGINFTVFTVHMLPAVLLVMLTTYIQIRIIYRDLGKLKFKDSPEVEELKHEIKVWKRAAQSMSIYSKDEDHMRDTLLKKVNRLKRNLQKSMKSSSQPAPNYQQTLDQLLTKYPIRNKVLLIKSGIALTFVIGLFFLHSIPAFQRVSLGWTALLGAILLLILADIEDIETILARVEWSTLLFFAALFILMEALAELGLIEMIGRMTESLILGVGTEHRLMVAILLILWVSAIASAFVDNIPLTTMMVKVTISLAQNEALNLPLQPLVWALALGACLGGNGTLIGASANVVCAGVAEQHGYKFTFLQFFKVGFPIMITSIVFSTVYLLVAHVACSWH